MYGQSFNYRRREADFRFTFTHYRFGGIRGLTEEEKKEQAELRQEYLAAVRKNLRAQLNNIDIQEKDGSIVNLGEKYGRKKGN